MSKVTQKKMGALIGHLQKDVHELLKQGQVFENKMTYFYEEVVSGRVQQKDIDTALRAMRRWEATMWQVRFARGDL